MKFLFFLLLFPVPLLAQVANDNIHQAKLLNVGEPSTSSTVDCTIEPSCVNYALTKKCLKYHNDQWFIINSGSHDFLYINVQDQECRDLLGVQLVVLKGEICDTENYKLLECVSFSSNDDFYVKLDSLETNQDYIINIDGYLHDLCSFTITADTVPYGIPYEVNMKMETSGKMDSSIVNISWEMPKEKSNQILYFEVLERTELFKHELAATIPVIQNAYGTVEKDYSFQDELTDNETHFYKLLAVDQKGQKFLLDEFEFTGRFRPKLNRITLNLRYKDGTPLTITIYDKESGRQYFKSQFLYNQIRHMHMSYPVTGLVEQGVTIIVVEVMNKSTKQVTKKEFVLQ